MRIIIFRLVFLYWIWPLGILGQDTILNQHNLWVISRVETSGEIVKNDSTKEIIDLNLLTAGIQIDLKYATKQNFLKKSSRNEITWVGGSRSSMLTGHIL